MKNKFIVTLVVLLTFVLSACAQFTNTGKSVMVDSKTFAFLDSNIIPSNKLAVTKGDISGNATTTTVIGIRGKPIAAPTIGDNGKFVKYDNASGSFIYGVGGGSTSDYAYSAGTAAVASNSPNPVSGSNIVNFQTYTNLTYVRYRDVGDGTVEDRQTGLFWTKNANLAGSVMTWHEATNYIAGLNAAKYLGYNDWRLPSIYLQNGAGGPMGMPELDTLGRAGGITTNTPFSRLGLPFVNVQLHYYWSSVTFNGNALNAFYVDMNMGDSKWDPKTANWYVWPVRGGLPITKTDIAIASKDIDLNRHTISNGSISYASVAGVASNVTEGANVNLRGYFSGYVGGKSGLLKQPGYELSGRVVIHNAPASPLDAVPAAASNSVVQVSAGNYHVLALRSDGIIVAWGNENYGNLDIPVAASNSVVSVAAGYYFSMALRSDGRVVTWGDNSAGVCNVPVDASNSVVAIAAGAYMAFALRSDGRVVAWGNWASQLSVPEAASNSVVAIAAGDSFVAALRSDGRVVVWGTDSYTTGILNVPVDASNGVIAISTFGDGVDNHQPRIVALRSDGGVVTWGYNFVGYYSVPAIASNGVIAVAASSSQSFALKSGGQVVVWGNPLWLPLSSDFSNSVIAISANNQYMAAIVGKQTTPGLIVTGDIVPAQSNRFDLGSTNYPFRDLFVSTNSVKYVGANGQVVATLSAATVGSLTGESTNLVVLSSASPTGANNVVTLGYLNSNGVSANALISTNSYQLGGIESAVYVTNNQSRVYFSSIGASVFSNVSQSPVPVYLASYKVWDWAWDAAYPKVPIYANDGSLSAPAYSFDYEHDLGIYRDSSGVLGFASLGTNTFQVDSIGVTVLGRLNLGGVSRTNWQTFVPTNRTITVNGVTGTLDTNVSFTVQSGSTTLPVTNITYTSTNIYTYADSGSVFRVTITNNVILRNPTNGVDGQAVTWWVRQDAVGTHTVDLDTRFKVPASASLPLSWYTNANGMTMFAARYDAVYTNWYVLSLVPGY